MTSVTVLAAILLGPQLWGSMHAITIASGKKVSASEKERKTESLTFSANGEDQLIFSDTTFQVSNDGSRRVPESIRRVGDAKRVEEFFESGWRPVYVFNSEKAGRKLSDQFPQESVHHTKVVAEPWNKTTRLFRFSESDIMMSPVIVQTEQSSVASTNKVRFKDDSSEEELSYEDSSQQLNVGEVNLVENYSGITPRMLKFEEKDRMKFEKDSPKTSKVVSESPKIKRDEAESVHSANYEVYLVEKLLKNTTDLLRAEDTDNKQDYSGDTQPRILQTERNIPDAENNTPTSSRNASRFFRFEDTVAVPETNPVRNFKFQDSHSSRDEFKFPKNDEPRVTETRYSSGKPFKFRESNNKPQNPASSTMRFEETPSTPNRFFNDASSIPHSTEDQFYTVKATIQIQESNSPAITPPTIPITTRRPYKKKKGKIYNQNGIDIRKQDGFNYQSPQEYDNYLQNGQHQANYQIPPTPQGGPDSSYYPNPNPGPVSPGTPYPPFDPSTYYIQNYLANYPYQQQSSPLQQPYADASASYPQQPNVPTNLINGGQSDSPISPQSIFGFLQSIFNFAPGTFGNYAGPQAPSPSSSHHLADPSGSGGGGGGAHTHHSASPISGSPIMSVSSQLRKALDNISGNDELQCVPKLICMMSRRSSGQGFSTYVNRGLLSTVLSAVPDSSPWLKFSRAALLGYGIGANSCDVYYPKCPKDEPEIIHYLNNHRGGFFRFFNDDHKSSSSSG
ncbi:uncharacterized protein LOC109426645 [Aedes albopictus]|uniref:Uncharacterized protein n=1 Tax=Aedes albopictus TaxID=7160 RepID=A0ABM1Y622_AEDAL|nr:uncharacterized protein LOC109426645 [Aedes albopictus]